MKIDKLAIDFFDDPEDFSRAMKLLHDSTTALAKAQSFQDYEEEFLADLDNLDEWLFSKAERFSKRVESKFDKLQQEISALREILRNSNSRGDSEELIQKIKESIHPPLSDEENPPPDRAV